MALTTRLDIRQTQSLVMTPQLQQAIKLLQLSNVEVSEYVEREIEQNPLIERDEPDGAEAAPVETGTWEGPPEPQLLDTVDPNNRNERGGEAPLDTDFENLWSDEGSGFDPGVARWGGGGGHGDFDEGGGDLENTLTRQATLRDHLFDQLNVDFVDPVDRLIGANFVDMIDESGYLAEEHPAQVAEAMGCSLEKALAVLDRLQCFDPPGIFARNLKECLALQLKERNRLDPAMAALLDNLDALARRDASTLLRLCGVSSEDLTDMVAEIRALNPKPGLIFDSSVAQPVIPDVLMRPQPGGGWLVELNQETLPRVLINQRYYATVSGQAKNKAVKEFLAERLQSANWLVKALHQRANTILRVSSEIVAQQDGFFRHGVSGLRPLVLRDIANAISMHESTVSRVTTNKYIATPRGLFELKYFFTTAIASSGGGEAYSAEAIRHRIRGLIDHELVDGVLSDDGIVDILRRDGVDIARRTVAKYREALGIPSSVQRRREKSVGL